MSSGSRGISSSPPPELVPEDLPDEDGDADITAARKWGFTLYLSIKRLPVSNGVNIGVNLMFRGSSSTLGDCTYRTSGSNKKEWLLIYRL